MSSPKTILPWTTLQRFLMLLSGLLLAGMLVFLLLYMPNLPETMPTHYDWQGNVNGYGSKYTVLFMPAFGLLMYGLMLLVSFFPNSWNTIRPPKPKNREAVLTYTRTFLCVITLFMSAMFGGMGLGFLGLFDIGTFTLVLCALMTIYIVIGIVRMNRMTK